MFSCYGTGGQRCTSTGNIILHEKIADKFKADFVDAIGRVRIGNPCLDANAFYGPMINEKFYSRFNEHFDMGKKDGAQLVTGKGRLTEQNKPHDFIGDVTAGHYVYPTLWDRVDMKMHIAQEEIFGPTVNMVTVKSFDEALTAANATNYGLSSAIFTQNPTYMHRFKFQMDAGMCSINNSTTGAEAHLPFGGTKGSGNGTRESGMWVIDAYSKWHAVNMDLAGKLQLAQIDTEYSETKSSIGDLNKLFKPAWGGKA